MALRPKRDLEIRNPYPPERVATGSHSVLKCVLISYILSEIKSAACLSLYEQYNSLSKNNGNWLCMHNLFNQIYGISTYITQDKKKYRIDGISNHLYKNDFYELINRTYNLVLKKSNL